MTQLEELDRAQLIHPVTEFRKHEKTGPRIVTGGEGSPCESYGSASPLRRLSVPHAKRSSGSWRSLSR